MKITAPLCIVLACFAAGCARTDIEREPEPDAGTVLPLEPLPLDPPPTVIDAGSPDAGSPDAGPPDAGPADAGPSDVCSRCDAHAACSGDAGCRCDTGYSGDGLVCVSVAPALSGLRWELPCLPEASTVVCGVAPQVSKSTVLQGQPGRAYDIQIRVRGVVETKQYLPGPVPAVPTFISMGRSDPNDPWNEYSLRVSSPANTYYLNHGASGEYRVVAADYLATFRASAGATLTLYAGAFDAREIRNVDLSQNPIVVPGVPPAPLAFDGQFLQMDVVGITEVP